MIFAYGNRDHAHFSLYTQSEIVGNPKFDDWFNNNFDEELLDRLKGRLNPHKKTILYLPTHSDLCSIDELAKELKRVAKIHNIIVKLHYYTPREESDRVRKLQDPNIICLNDDADLITLLKVADVVLSDNSSAIFDAILADKPLIVTDFVAKEFLDRTHRQKRQYRRGKPTELTYSGSIEQEIKRKGLVVTFQKSEELEHALEKGLEDAHFFQTARKRLRDELFAYTDSSSGQRAAAAIRKFLVADLPEKPLFYHVIESFEASFYRTPFSERKLLVKKISKYEHLLFETVKEEYGERVIFSAVVLVYDRSETSFLTATLRSLLGQNFPRQNYEIIIVNGPPEKQVEEIIKGISKMNTQIPTIKYVVTEDTNSNLKFIDDAIHLATGEIVCFTESGYIVPSSWLLDFYIAYKTHPDVVGIGGHVIKRSSIYTIFDEYYYLELGKKFGMSKEPNYMRNLYEIKNNLFYQNPAGTLVNMSYKKKSLKDLPINYQRMYFLELLEMEIKQKLLQMSDPLCFVPTSVTGLEKMTYRRFIQKNFNEGLSFYLFCLSYPNYKKYYSYSIFSVVTLPLANVFSGYQKINLSFVIGIGTFFRWLGGVYGRSITWKNRYT